MNGDDLVRALAEPARLRVLDRFVSGGKLTRLPAKWERKKFVLEHIAAQAFRADVCYSEHEVNAILRAWCDGGETDHVTVRRYLVDLQFLTRVDGVYTVNPAFLPVGR